MNKNNSKGFMLTETLIVTVFVCTVLVLLFSQIQKVEENYQRTYMYNSVSSLYATKNIKDYLMNNYIETLIKDYAESSEPYLDITDCGMIYYESSNYCKKLYDDLKVQKILFLASDFYEVKYTDISSSKLTQGMLDFIDYVNEDNGDNRYRLVVSFKDGTFATVKIKGDRVYEK